MKKKILIGVFVALIVVLFVILQIHFYNERSDANEQMKKIEQRSEKIKKLTGVQNSIGNIFLNFNK